MADFGSIRFQPRRPLLSELTADRLNSIVAEIKQNKPIGERGITVRQSGGQTYIGLAASSKSVVPIATHPFQIQTSSTNTNQYNVTVRPGTLNALLPVNLFTNGALTQLSYQGNQLKYVILTGTSDGIQFQSASLSVENQAATAQEPVIWGLPQTAQFVLGVVYNSSVFQIISDNIEVAAVLAAVTQKETELAVGELPYNNYYVWGQPSNGAVL